MSEDLTYNKALLAERKSTIRRVIKEQGEDNFYVSYSGGRDSSAVSALIDLAVPGNSIPRVYADTGMEYNMIKDFVFEQKEKDDRIKVIEPSLPIKKHYKKRGILLRVKRIVSCWIGLRERVLLTA